MSDKDSGLPPLDVEQDPTAKGLHAEGTGGLTLEAPDPADITNAPIGFAPDLEAGPRDALWDPVPVAPPAERRTFTPRPPPPQSPGADADYPLARRVLQRILSALAPAGRPPAAPPPAAQPAAAQPAAAQTPAPDASEPSGPAIPVDSAPLASFAVGQSIMKAPPPIITPPPERPELSAAAQAAQGHLEDMVDVVLVGAPDSGDHEIHLMFKEDVLRGLYLRLERRDDGLFAHFTVADDTTRRAIEGEVHTLLARLEARGMKLAGHTIALKE